MVVVRVVMVLVEVLRTQNFLMSSRAWKWYERKIFLSSAARGSGTRGSGGVAVVRTQNFVSPAARGSVPRGSGTNENVLSSAARGSVTNANYCKSSRAW